MKKYISVIFLIIYCSTAISQENEIKNDKHFFKNRWEALLSKNVSASFRILSFTSAKPINYEDKDTLQVHFYMPDNTKEAIINSSKIIQDNSNYQMLVENKKWKNGWNVFKPWSIKDVIAKHNIKAKNLGVLITRNDRVFIPALITKASKNLNNIINNYDVYFFTPVNITELTYRVISKTTNEIVNQGSLEDIEATDSFKLSLDMKNKVAGNYKLIIQIKRISGMKSSKTFRFYHRNKY